METGHNILDKLLLSTFLVQVLISIYLASNLTIQVFLSLFLVSSFGIYTQLRASKIVVAPIKEPTLEDIKRECEEIEAIQFGEACKSGIEISYSQPIDRDPYKRREMYGDLRLKKIRELVEQNGRLMLWEKRNQRRKK